MSDIEVCTDLVLVHSEQTATIHAAIDKIDIADWLLNLPDAEYQRCAPPDHIAAGSTTTDDGRPNVDQRRGGRGQPRGAALRRRDTRCAALPYGVAQRPTNPRRLGQGPGDLGSQRHRRRRGHL